jgi:hypothetical protein
LAVGNSHALYCQCHLNLLPPSWLEYQEPFSRSD